MVTLISTCPHFSPVSAKLLAKISACTVLFQQYSQNENYLCTKHYEVDTHPCASFCHMINACILYILTSQTRLYLHLHETP